jgi:hypothetical protein
MAMRGYRIRKLNVHRAIGIKHRAANRNPAPREYTERKMRELQMKVDALNDMAARYGFTVENDTE